MIAATPFPQLRGLFPLARGDAVPAFQADQHGNLPADYAGSAVLKARAAGGFSAESERHHGAGFNRRITAAAAGKETHVSQPAEQGSNDGQ
ncbi:hypothetical protein [Sphingomonas abaci]|uniref:Uncharacterized protein n=1 Tax=Sphingomonas abaci TaxID=237611 RepID=A0A7W7AL04_9SPHN|nr:hypothetical protein [Sphingomonas abaci]MBB4618984.1 hypothetical protein [Sphingomonas abaci]